MSVPEEKKQAVRVICTVEDGWRGMRIFSLSAVNEGAAVTVLIRGHLDPELTALIRAPEGMRLITVEDRWFRWRLILELLRSVLRSGERALVVDKIRTERLMKPLVWLTGSRVHRLLETPEGFHFEGSGPKFLVQRVSSASEKGTHALSSDL